MDQLFIVEEMEEHSQFANTVLSEHSYNRYSIPAISQQEITPYLEGDQKDNQVFQNTPPALPKSEENEYTYWPRQVTLSLIQEYKKHYKMVGKSIRSFKKLFEIISEILNKLFNLQLSGTQVSNKWKSLDRSYKAVVDNNQKTGRGRKFFEFEDEMNEIFGKSRRICPEILLTSATEVKFPNKRKISAVRDLSSEIVDLPLTSTKEDEVEVISDVVQRDQKGTKTRNLNISFPSTATISTPKKSLKRIKKNRNDILEQIRQDRLQFQNERAKYIDERLQIEKEKLLEKKRRNNLIEERNQLLKMCLEQGVTLPSNI